MCQGLLGCRARPGGDALLVRGTGRHGPGDGEEELELIEDPGGREVPHCVYWSSLGLQKLLKRDTGVVTKGLPVQLYSDTSLP